MGNPNIGNEAKKAWTTFKKWESGNYKWRPKRGIAAVNEQLIKEWYHPATKADIESNFMSLLNADESKLKELLADLKQPMLVRIVIKNILGGKWYEIADKMMDRGIGKAVQREEVKHDISYDWSELLLKIQTWVLKKEDAYDLMRKLKDTQ
jgi:hypothetical protein